MSEIYSRSKVYARFISSSLLRGALRMIIIISIIIIIIIFNVEAFGVIDDLKP